MGGAQAGEIASRIAASALRDSGPGAGEDAVVALIQEANRRVYEAATSDEARAGMGTTMTAALVEDDTVRIGHVGDSRAYRVRDGALQQLTDDHSLVAELVRSGRLSPEEADVHPQRSVITRVLGTDPEVDVDTFEVEARPGDVFMICSDGLTSMVDDASILELVERNRDEPRPGRPRARRRREQGRRRGQHHRDRLRARRRRRGGQRHAARRSPSRPGGRRRAHADRARRGPDDRRHDGRLPGGAGGPRGTGTGAGRTAAGGCRAP